jgi:hypothetical protein
MITTDEAKNLKKDNFVYSVLHHNNRRLPKPYKVNGNVKTWVDQPYRVRIPCIYVPTNEDIYFDESDLFILSLDPNYIIMAENMIENEDDELYVFRDMFFGGQIIGNIKHTSMFKARLVAYLEDKSDAWETQRA